MFEEILEEQISNKDIKGQHPLPDGISIEIKNNAIYSIKNGEPFNNCHNRRKGQYIALVENTLKIAKIKDCYININLVDLPKPGCFNFNRRRNVYSHFLLPNHRFTLDDIPIVDIKADTKTFTEEVLLIRSLCTTPFENKISKIYTSSIPHLAKIDYFKFSLNNPFCDGYLMIGSCHKNLAATEELVKILIKKKYGRRKCCTIYKTF